MNAGFFRAKTHLLLLVAALALALTLETAVSGRARAADDMKRFTGAKAGDVAPVRPQAASRSAGSEKARNAKTSSDKTPAKKASSKKTARRTAQSQMEAAAKLPWPENVKALAGTGAVLVVDPHAGRGQPTELFGLNADRPYVPASIIKLLTAAAALDVLGPDYRFQTDFYLDENQGLWIVGRGDPFLVSEEICLIAQSLAALGLKEASDVYLDTSFFEPGLILDGVTYTLNPYDAFNGALGVNFNTVNYLIDTEGRIVESNECTPLTPTALDLAEKNRPRKRRKKKAEYRLNISESPLAAERQAGQFFKAALEKAGVAVAGEVILGGVLPPSARPLYSHVNSLSLSEMLAVLLEHSNNFMTNQIFLTMGAEKFGAPANLEKGLKAVESFLSAKRLPKLQLAEGSGLSRNTAVTARQMADVLAVFEPDRELLKSLDDGAVRYKTGTMHEVQTLAGYLTRPERPEEPLSFVIMLNGPYAEGVRGLILKAIQAQFVAQPASGA
jgi:D-alanyl-D-alanine carboxypeptidase/D-alanyl-D-alanine-endopeptidase (penicillin-binding protein 4)